MKNKLKASIHHEYYIRYDQNNTISPEVWIRDTDTQRNFKFLASIDLNDFLSSFPNSLMCLK